jgi:RNA polymerase sigma-70 factor (ECF subfamily)
MDTERKKRFLALLEPVYPRLSRYALAITRNREEAKDLVSEAVLVALERFDTIRDEASFAGFLFRIVLRTHRHWHYRERLKTPFNKASAEAIEDSGVAPDKSAEIAIVMSALERLPVKVKETVLLFDVADLSLEAVREIQGGTLSGVKSRLRRGHETLRKILGAEKKIEAIRAIGKKREENISIESEEAYAL